MKVGIIGAGTMGAGIAQAFAMTDGYEVCLCDIKQEFADGGKGRILKDSELPRRQGENHTGEGRCYRCQNYNRLKGHLHRLRFSYRVAPENMQIKKTTFKELEAIVKPTAFLQPTPLPFPLPKSVQVLTDP